MLHGSLVWKTKISYFPHLIRDRWRQLSFLLKLTNWKDRRGKKICIKRHIWISSVWERVVKISFYTFNQLDLKEHLKILHCWCTKSDIRLALFFLSHLFVNKEVLERVKKVSQISLNIYLIVQYTKNHQDNPFYSLGSFSAATKIHNLVIKVVFIYINHLLPTYICIIDISKLYFRFSYSLQLSIKVMS